MKLIDEINYNEINSQEAHKSIMPDLYKKNHNLFSISYFIFIQLFQHKFAVHHPIQIHNSQEQPESILIPG